MSSASQRALTWGQACSPLVQRQPQLTNLREDSPHQLRLVVQQIAEGLIPCQSLGEPLEYAIGTQDEPHALRERIRDLCHCLIERNTAQQE